MTIKHHKFAEQKLAFQDVSWRIDANEQARPSIRSGTRQGIPRPGHTGPYWSFRWELTHDGGIAITDLEVRDSQSAGINEPVAKRIDFADLGVRFVGASALTPFDVAAAFGHPESKFVFKVDGDSHEGADDHRFQYGLLLELVHEFGGSCKVTLRVSVVFGSSGNDFDPGGIPVALKVFPQVAYTWVPGTGATTKRVTQFRASVRTVVNNYLTPEVKALIHAAGHAEGTNPDPETLPSTIASFFADTNLDAGAIRERLPFFSRAYGASVVLGQPFGWATLFDYMRGNVGQQAEHIMVKPYIHDAPFRENTYAWPAGLDEDGNPLAGTGFRVRKHPRQGNYDNVHIHARMPMLDSRDNVQIHAPFCGHSCVHVHWRWSWISSSSARGGRDDQYKGWCPVTLKANTAPGAPLIPPNQRLTVAICGKDQTRSSPDQILSGGAPLPALEKMIWYCVDVLPRRTGALVPPDEQQVIMEHGWGWAYKYSWDEKGSATQLLDNVFEEELDDPPTQGQLMRFFEEDVYPTFRYYDGGKVHQVPEGNAVIPDGAGRAVAPEDL